MTQRLLLLLLLTATLAARAQDDESIYRLELGGGVGMALPYTDVKDKMGAGAQLIARFPLNPRMAIKTALSYYSLKGSTDDVSNYYPTTATTPSDERLRYKVSDALLNLYGMYELHFLPYGYEKGYQGYKRLVPYIQLGLGAVYGKAGKAFTLDIPLGVGAKYKVGARLNLGVDYTMHFTLSDKLDGLDAPLGIKSSLFRNKDHYGSLNITLTYDLNPRCPTCNKY